LPVPSRVWVKRSSLGRDQTNPVFSLKLGVTYFENVVRARMTEQFGYKNRMQVPALDKMVLNMGIGEGVTDRKNRRTRQLHHRHQGAHHPSGDRLRQGGGDLGNGGRGVHHGQDR
jgi:hypothetical protein